MMHNMERGVNGTWARYMAEGIMTGKKSVHARYRCNPPQPKRFRFVAGPVSTTNPMGSESSV